MEHDAAAQQLSERDRVGENAGLASEEVEMPSRRIMPEPRPARRTGRARSGLRGATSPPRAYSDFIARFPELGQAWDTIGEAGRRGPLDERTVRLVKLGIAMGAFREGAVRSGVRKALALGIAPAEIEQVVALAAGTLGLPSTVAIDTWVQPLLAERTRTVRRAR